MSRRSRVLAPLGGALAAALLVAAPGPAIAGPPQSGPAGPVLPATTVAGSTAQLPTTAGLQAVLDPLLTKAALGSHSAVVLDAATGQALFERRAEASRVPASTMKLLTAAAALTVLGPDARLATVALADDPTAREVTVTLVGGGDTTLTRAAGGPWASLASLADQLAGALAVDSVRLRFDDSAFTGPRLGPGWPAGFPASGIVAPVSALMVDQGRVRPGANARVAKPARQAASVLATMLRERGLMVSGVARGRAAAGAVEVARVESPPMATLVDRMLTESDNDLAEAIAHLLGGRVLQQPSFAGGAEAVRGVVTELGLPTAGLDIADGSGLSGRNRLTATTLAVLLAEAAGGDSAALSGMNDGLAVAGFTGTLADRFVVGSATEAAGVVRAKTGTLTGVASLAGTLRTDDGRVLTFAVIGNKVRSAGRARVAADAFAARLVDCGCR